jgi:hypothetical protein
MRRGARLPKLPMDRAVLIGRLGHGSGGYVITRTSLPINIAA